MRCETPTVSELVEETTIFSHNYRFASFSFSCFFLFIFPASQFCRYINKALDTIFETTVDDLTIPSMASIGEMANNAQESLMEAFESAKDLLKKTESSVEAGVQQFYQEIGEKTTEERKDLIIALLEAAAHNSDSDSDTDTAAADLTQSAASVAQSILDAANQEEIVKCAAAVLGKASQKFSSMAAGLLGAVIDSVADDSDGKTAERALIITQDVKDMLNKCVWWHQPLGMSSFFYLLERI